jgi:signal transduction histidine kinase
MFIYQARRLEIDYQVHYPEFLEQVFLHIDVNKCGQVLRNMISNALKFTPAGGTVKLVCKLENALGEPLTAFDESSADQDVNFRFEVHDTGPGISQVCSASNWCLYIVGLPPYELSICPLTRVL